MNVKEWLHNYILGIPITNVVYKEDSFLKKVRTGKLDGKGNY